MLRTVSGTSGAHRSESPTSGQPSGRQQEGLDGVIAAPEPSERMELPVTRVEAFHREVLTLSVAIDAQVTDRPAARINDAPGVDPDRHELYL